MFKLASTVLAMVLAVTGYSALGTPIQDTPEKAQAAPAPLVIPPKASQRTNPIKLTDESIARAKKIYALDCAMCHGTKGDGKGELAVSAKFVLKDYRNPESLKNSTDGDLFYIIRTGYANMPAEDQRAKDEDVWALVHYLRSFSAQKPAAQIHP
jgi:mono/diheme cytochrome c family protein